MKEFYLPTRLITGSGCVSQLAATILPFGRNVLLVCGRNALRRSGILGRMLDELQRAGMRCRVYDAVAGEPTLDMVREIVALCHAEPVDVLIGIGGGSAMDAAKAAAGLANQPGPIEEYHRGRALTEPALPIVTVPTTAGTGAEVTNNAVLADTSAGIKQSIRGPGLFARAALVDPELTLSLSPSVTATSGADALCQAIESFVGLAAQPATDGLASEAIRLTGRSLVRAYDDGKDIAARSDMLYGSLLAGMALTNARLGGVHGLSSPLGYHYEIPHGLVCGVLLPFVMEYSLPYAPEKYRRVAELLQGGGVVPEGTAGAAQAVKIIRDILTRIGIPSGLCDLGVNKADFEMLVAESLSSSNNKNNPKPLGADDLLTILNNAF